MAWFSTVAGFKAPASCTILGSTCWKRVRESATQEVKVRISSHSIEDGDAQQLEDRGKGEAENQAKP